MANPAENSNRSYAWITEEAELQVSVPASWSVITTAILPCFLPSKTHNEESPPQPASPACLQLSHFDVALWLDLKNKDKAKGLFNTKYYVQQTPPPGTHLQAKGKAPRIR